MNSYGSFGEILMALKKHHVQYMIVGGIAVGFYGYVRPSISRSGHEVDEPDLDISYNPTYDNYFHLLDALEELKIDVSRYRREKAPDPKTSFFRYRLVDCTFDIIPKLHASLIFSSSYKKGKFFDRNGLEIPIISLDDLIHDKEVSGRPKDLLDIENLRRINLPDTI